MRFNILKLLFVPIILLLCSAEKNKEKEESITCVVYKIARPQLDPNRIIQKSKINAPEELRARVKNSIEQMYNLEFELYYDKQKSLYKVSDRLEINNVDAKSTKIISGGDKIRFKDIEAKEKMYQTEFDGQVFNITLPYEEYKWDITTETKIINGYKCYKATSMKKEYDKTRKRENVFYPVVWFTPEIPVSFGPNGLDGLPGLVLEGSPNGHKYYFATKIIFDYKGTEKIKRPVKGKEVTELEISDIMTKRVEEIMNEK
jgi:GLPGLI family protein